MKKVLIYTSIGLIIIMLFTANSVVAWSFGDSYSPAHTEATNPGNILDADDNVVCNVGTATTKTGHITVIFDEDFQDEEGRDDITIYGYNTDGESEKYEVYATIYVDQSTPINLSWYLGYAYDSDGQVDFDMGGLEGTYNALHIISMEDGGTLTYGTEIDAVYVKNTV
jgi:hypothetical protein